jgi:hypothetical protein
MKMKKVTLPGGGSVTIPDDGRPVELLKFPDGEGIQYADGTRVTFRAIGSKAAAPAKPALTPKQIADGIVTVLKPILKAQNEKIAALEARIAMLEARLGS